MRSPDTTQDTLFSYRTLEERISSNHPLRKLRLLVDCSRRPKTEHVARGIPAQN